MPRAKVENKYSVERSNSRPGARTTLARASKSIPGAGINTITLESRTRERVIITLF
jgi:hypothetical protein